MDNLLHRRINQQRIITWNYLFIWIFLCTLCYSFPTPDDYYDNSPSLGDSLGAPIITPTTAEITLEANSNYTLRCESKEPIEWILPELFENPLYYLQEPYPTQDPIRPYGNQLVLYNVSAYNVGYYYCINKGVSDNPNFLDEEITLFRASKIYIFVNDLDTLLAPLEHPIVQAFQYSDVIVPCKPTSKDVEVELKSTTNEETSFDHYDPKIGFTLFNVVHSQTLFCKSVHTIDSNRTYDQIHFLDVRPTRATTTATTVTNPVTQNNQSILNLLRNSIDEKIYYTSSNDIINKKDTNTSNNATATTTTTTKIINNNKNNQKRYANINKIYYKVSSTTPASWSKFDGYGQFSTMKSVTGSINRPVIISDDRGHAYEGSTFNLTCNIEVIPNLLFNMSWDTPNNNIALKEGRAVIHPTRKSESNDMLMMGKSVITIYNADKKKDSGVYKCSVEDNSKNKNSNTFRMLILGQNEHYITLHEASNNTHIRKMAGKLVQIVVYYNGYPMPSIRWYNKDNIPIPATSPQGKYTIMQSERDVILKIRNVTLKDSGIYTVRATNGIDTEELKFNLAVKDKPTASVDSVYIQAGEEASVVCKSDAYPPANITWSFTPCKIQPVWPTCSGASTPTFLDKKLSYAKEETENHKVSELRFKPSQPGLVKCTAQNELGIADKEAEILIGDLVQPIVVYGVEEDRQIAVGDEVILTCGALAYNYSADMFWYQDNIMVEPTKDIEIKNSHSAYSYKKVLKFKNIQHENAGSYECRVRPIIDDGSGKYESRILQIKVHDPLAPIMDTTNLVDGKIDANLGDKLLLQCKPSGIPKPTVTWYKDDIPIGAVQINESNHILEENGTILKIQFVKPEDEGTYRCQVSNRLGTIHKSTQVKISNMPGLQLGWILVILAIIVILIISIICLCIRILKERELLRQMKAAGLANFEEGAVDHINPALSLDEQADLLPYDRRFEFPREKLRLGKQLGAGAFGVVLKGVAENILPDEKETTVAVKMVKKTANNEVMRALVSELKIMVHLGQHLNVVNLLGAVTKNIAKREVMVIVEYCRYGNVQNFLLKNRKRFINQINPDTDQIDPTITTRDPRLSDYDYNSQGLKYAKLTFSHLQLNNSKGDSCGTGDRKSTGLKVGPNSTGYIRQSELYVGGNVDSCNTEQTLISSVNEGDESVILSNNSVQPAWRSNYKPDGSAAMDITTTHLISWAFQVARGMDYLASRKVLHGDLAARNILLCDDNVVKICDFGLARSMYRSDNYKKQGEALLPIKWLALESLGDQIFSTHSDVWSFGIVLWEFFSLAKVPYPGMEADQSLYLKLKDGYRMEKPEYANQELYDIMLECWSTNPESRPLFSELEKRFANLLEDEVTNHYIDLNEPYLRMNSEYYKTGQTDYLALMGCPEEQAPQAPRYVNGNLVTDSKPDINAPPPPTTSSSAYLHMSPKSSNIIFSPRPQDDYIKTDHFKFPEPVSPTISNNLDSPISKQRTKKANIPEEIPMLNNSHYDSEAELSPDHQNKIQQKNIFPKNNIRETILSTDDNNYVNVNSNKIGLGITKNYDNDDDINNRMQINGNKDAFSNPSYHILTTPTTTVGGDKLK